MMEDVTSNIKRARDESDESPETKRFRADLILDILEDVDSVDRNPDATGELATVMKSFEEEMTALLSPPPQQTGEEEGVNHSVVSTSDSDDLRQPHLGYLLEASDDELGLPPTVPSSSDEAAGAADDGDLEGGGDQEVDGLGQIWGFEDEIPSCYDPLDFGRFGDDDDKVGGGDDGVVFDVGLFDYPDMADYSWRPESLPAI